MLAYPASPPASSRLTRHTRRAYHRRMTSPTLEPATPLQLVAVLPPGEWQLISFRGLIVAACPQHAPVVINYIPDVVSNDTC